MWWCKKIKKKCPKCSFKAVRLYQNKSVNNKRKWIPVFWWCTKCFFTYKVASDTLIYKTADEPYKTSYKGKCPKCGLKLVRLYRHINPKEGKQKWTSEGWYCSRCKYAWMKK
jgi:hypothetical protein